MDHPRNINYNNLQDPMSSRRRFAGSLSIASVVRHCPFIIVHYLLQLHFMFPFVSRHFAGAERLPGLLFKATFKGCITCINQVVRQTDIILGHRLWPCLTLVVHFEAMYSYYTGPLTVFAVPVPPLWLLPTRFPFLF